MNVFVVSGMGPNESIIASGIAGNIVKQHGENYRTVNGKGPYHTAYIFEDTTDNRRMFEDFIRRSKKRKRCQHTDMFQTLNAIKHGHEEYKGD